MHIAPISRMAAQVLVVSTLLLGPAARSVAAQSYALAPDDGSAAATVADDPSAIVDPSSVSSDDSGAAPAPAPAPAPVPFVDTPVPPGAPYGLSVFVWGQPKTTDRDLGLVKQAGFSWQKSLFQWREIEGRGKGQFDWTEADRVVAASNKAGINIMARVDFEPMWARADHAHNGRPDNLQDFADFARAFADRYKPGSPHGTVAAMEVWNEPNLQREWGEPISAQSAANYVQMLKLAYPAIKSVNPAMLVVTAGLSPTGWSDDTARPDDQFLQWMFDAGLSGNYDVLGLHGNSQVSDPTAAPGSVPGLSDGSFYFRRVEQLRAIQEQNGDAARKIWLLEFGWTADRVHPAYSWFSVSEDQKAQNILTAIQYARANWPWLGNMFLWTLSDPTWNQDREEYWWAISNPDGSPRPALTRILAAARAGQLPNAAA